MNRFGVVTGTVLLGFFAACASNEKPNPVSTGSTSGSTGSGTGGAGGKMPAAGPHIPGLTAPVHAVYDENGLLHLSCAADNDCYAALGYFHAQNRFFFMDFIRNLVRGKLGSLVKAGSTVLAKDYAHRQFFTTRQGDPLEVALYDAASDQVKGHIDAYTKGVNAWIGDMRNGANGATLTPEYDFALIVKANIRDWEAPDSAAVGLYMLNSLSNESDAELEKANDAPKFPAPLAADLFSSKPVFAAYTLPAATGMAPQSLTLPFSPAIAAAEPWRPIMNDARAFLSKVGTTSAAHHADVGSNNWAVAPTRTSGGHALLANDPHLPLMNPSVWFPVEIDSKSAGKGGVYHVEGGTFPGLPSVMIGHNESIGWGVTTAYYDLADEYLETLTPDGGSVVFNGQNVPIVQKTFAFADASTNKTVTQTFEWVPHHGPIISKDTTKKTAISLRWAGADAGTDLDAFFGMARAGSVAEAQTALQKASSADQNFVVVDQTGNVAWYPYSKVPSRPWASPLKDPSVPLPGDGSAEWQGNVPFDMLPQVTNPSKGFVATANNDMTGASADGDLTNDYVPAIQAWDKADGTREQRIIDGIAAGGNSHSVASMQALQGDTYSLYGSFAVPLLLNAANGQALTPGEQAVVDALSKWKLTCPTGLEGTDPVMSPKAIDPSVSAESIGCTAFHVVFYSVVREALSDEGKVANLDISSSDLALNLVARALNNPSSLEAGDNFWDDVSTTGVVETRDDILRRAIADAALELAPLGGEDDWRWGRIHTLSTRSIFDSFGLTTYNYGPFAAPGGQYTVNVASPNDWSAPMTGKAPDYAFSDGPSLRVVMEAAPSGITMSFVYPGGADLHRTSPFYNNLMPNWLANKPVEFPFGPKAVLAPAIVVDVDPG